MRNEDDFPTVSNRAASMNGATFFGSEISLAAEHETARGYLTVSEMLGELRMLEHRIVNGDYQKHWRETPDIEKRVMIENLIAKEVPQAK
jgi:hypothetical protein